MNKESILKRLFEEQHITFEELMILSKEEYRPAIKDLTKDNCITWKPFQNQPVPNFPTMS